MWASWRGASSKRNCIGTSNAKNGDLYYVFWQWKWMSVVIRLKVPIEMHYTVIPMGTSEVNSFHECLEAMREDNHCCCFVVWSDWKTTGQSRHVVVISKGRTAVSAPPIDARDRCLLLTLGVWNVQYVKYIICFSLSQWLSLTLQHCPFVSPIVKLDRTVDRSSSCWLPRCKPALPDCSVVS